MVEFFEKVKQGVSQGITIVTIKSKEAIETTKVKSQLATLRNQMKDAMYELGNIVYTMSNNDNYDLERIKNKCIAIGKLEKQIKDKENELDHIHTRAREELGKQITIGTCECGAAIYEHAKFCGKCGKKL